MPKSTIADKKVIKKLIEKVENAILIDVYDVKGKIVRNIELSQSVFGEKINNSLLAQAVRVYRANQRHGTASTKNRGEVRGSTRKIYQQKGTGRARHGAIRAPIFVKGGIAHGPRPHDFSLVLPQKMRKAAMRSALSAKINDNMIRMVEGISNINVKTKEAVAMLSALSLSDGKNILIVLAASSENISRALRNIKNVSYVTVGKMNTYDVIRNKHIICMVESIPDIDKAFAKRV
ncbi:MAG: 50S ribosomal protein L4 [Candidatus Levybacteria bacterium]|nr:50S ribosomal protein L4 [Candidatus Levybacteria bacterium]